MILIFLSWRLFTLFYCSLARIMPYSPNNIAPLELSMRIASITLAVALIAVVTTGASHAQAQGQSTPSAPHVFGSGNCPQKIPCPDSHAGFSDSDYASAANKCITSYFGYSNPDGFFDTIGLDSNNCLAYIPGSIPKGVGGALTAQCCVEKNAVSGTCYYHCDLVIP
jgi:hypothetical protein